MINTRNQFLLVGNVGQDPELKETASISVANISIATKDKKKDGDKWVNITDWHYVTLFGQTAEYFCKFVNKGDLVAVQGKIKYNKYDTEDGRSVTKTNLIGDTWDIYKSKVPAEDGGQESNNKKQDTNGW